MKTRILLATTALLAVTTAQPAMADGRSVMFVKGMATSIAAHCPNFPLDKNLMRSTKRISGVHTGAQADFSDGVKYINDILSTGEGPIEEPVTCMNICSIRPGTCYFIKKDAEPVRSSITPLAVTAAQAGQPKMLPELLGYWCYQGGENILKNSAFYAHAVHGDCPPNSGGGGEDLIIRSNGYIAPEGQAGTPFSSMELTCGLTSFVRNRYADYTIDFKCSKNSTVRWLLKFIAPDQAVITFTHSDR
jgi:hypothetical protein